MRSDQAILFCKVKPSSICVHGTGNRGNRGKDQNKKSLANLKNVRYNGFMSKATQRKCSSFLEAWIYTLGYNENRNSYTVNTDQAKLQFVTLTLSAKQLHTDQQIRREMLTPFLQDLQRDYGTKHYFWKAEKQRNGRLHFHILISSKISWSRIRQLWNKQQLKLGYIDRYRQDRKRWHSNGFKVDTSKIKHWSKENQLRAYGQGKATNWSNPNSTDIHTLKQVRSAHSYIVKYCIKSTDTNKVNGRIWGCSDSIRALVFTSKPIGSVEHLDLMNLLRKTKAAQVEGDHFSVTYNFTTTQLQLHAPSLFFRLFKDLARFSSILNGTYTKQPDQPPKPKPPPNPQQHLTFSTLPTIQPAA